MLSVVMDNACARKSGHSNLVYSNLRLTLPAFCNVESGFLDRPTSLAGGRLLGSNLSNLTSDDEATFTLLSKHSWHLDQLLPATAALWPARRDSRSRKETLTAFLP